MLPVSVSRAWREGWEKLLVMSGTDLGLGSAVLGLISSVFGVGEHVRQDAQPHLGAVGDSEATVPLHGQALSGRS